MKKLSTLAIAALLAATGGMALGAGKGKTTSATSADCNRVYKAKADAGTQVSTKQLADELKLPVETVQHCLRLKRRQGPRLTPRPGQ